MEEDRTIHAGEDARTERASEEMTIHAEEMGTVRATVEEKTVRVADEVAVEKELELGGRVYRRKRVISSGSGEAEVYLVEREGREYALKLYYPGVHPDYTVLETLRDMGKTGVLLELVDFGKYRDAGTGEMRDYTLAGYLRGGSLMSYGVGRDAGRLRELAMQAAIAIDFCHRNGIIHRDVKPSNFIFTDEGRERLVLGDFGIAMYCEDTTLFHPSRQARTPVYAAPELYQNVIDGVMEINNKVDFYSLGIVLISLWNGEEVSREKERDFLKRKGKGDLPYPADIPVGLLTLLKGLTVADPVRRWGFEEIKRWYMGEEVPVETLAARDMCIVFNSTRNQVARSTQELAGMMRDDERLGGRYLYSGQLGKWLYEYELSELGAEMDHVAEEYGGKDEGVGWRVAIHTLDPGLPYRLECTRGGEVYPVDCATGDEVIRAFREHSLTGAGRKSLTDAGFLAWFRNQGEPVVAEELEAIVRDGSEGKEYAVVYALNKRVSYNFYLPGETVEEDYCFTVEQVGAYLNGLAAVCFRREGDAEAERELGQLARLKGTRLYYYLRSKGWMKYVDWVNYCFELESKDNTSKCGPYNRVIATYKAIRGMGWVPYYDFPVSGKRVCSPRELGGVVRGELREELQNGFLADWLAVFYQEDPFVKFEQEFDYERKVQEYVLKLKEIAPRDERVVRYAEARARLKRGVRGIGVAGMMFQVSRLVLGVLTLVPLLVLIGWSIRVKFPLSEGVLPLLPWKLFAGVLVAGAVWNWVYYKFDFASLLTWQSARKVMFFYYLSFGALYAIPAVYGWMYVPCFAGGVLVYVLYRPIFSVRGPRVKVERDFEKWEVEPLYHAFKGKAGEVFRSKETGLNRKRAMAYEDATRRFVRMMVPSMVAAWGLLAAFVFYHPDLGVLGGKKIAGYGQFVTLPGSAWSGEAGGEELRVYVERVDPFTGKVSGFVKHSTGPERAVKGMLDATKKSITWDTGEKSTGRERFTGRFDADLKAMDGTFTPGKGKARRLVFRRVPKFREVEWVKRVFARDR